MLGLLNTVLSRGGSLLTYVKDGLVMANRFLTPPKLTFPVDASAAFNGTSDFIQLDTPLISGTQDFSVSAWHKGEFYNGSSKAIFATYGSSNTGGFEFYFSPNGLTLYIGSGLHAPNPPSDEWNFLVATRQSGSTKIFINGSLAASGTQSNSITTNANARIGSATSNVEFINGNLANVAFWNRALTSDEINSVMWKTYEQVSTTESNGLQAWYKLSADEVISGDSTATLTTYANANSLTFEAPACVQTALNGLPDITDARLYSANYDIRVNADGGNVESLNCVETELNAIL